MCVGCKVTRNKSGRDPDFVEEQCPYQIFPFVVNLQLLNTDDVSEKGGAAPKKKAGSFLPERQQILLERSEKKIALEEKTDNAPCITAWYDFWF